MKRWHRMYYFGMALLMLLSITGELIWLPDPVRFGNCLFWIDAVDLFVYLLALIPLIWMSAALLRMLAEIRVTGFGWNPDGEKRIPSRIPWTKFRRGAVLATGAVSTVAIVTVPKQLQFSAASLGITWLLVFIDLFFDERNRRKIPIQSLSAFMVTVCLLLVFFCPTSYLVTYPGLTMNMNRYAQVKGGSGHGEISGVLVFERPAFPIDWLYARLFPHYTFEHIKNLGMSIGAYNQLVRNMKKDANAAGSAIAFQKVGKGNGITSNGVLITDVIKNSPVEGIMLPGDVIEDINGYTVTSVQELTDRMSLVVPGHQVEVSVLRGGSRVEFTAGTRANPDAPKRAAFGIQVSNEWQYDIPGTIIFHNYLLHEGGPSHGVMLALALIDQLTPCGVTYGNHVAGTGTIGPGGSVGPIGGAEQKTYTVNRAGADVFFVPVENEAEAKRGAPKLQIVPVHSLDDILKWLQTHPKNGIEPSC